MPLFTVYYFSLVSKLYSFLFIYLFIQYFIFSIPKKRIRPDIESNLRLSVLKDLKQLGIRKLYVVSENLEGKLLGLYLADALSSERKVARETMEGHWKQTL